MNDQETKGQIVLKSIAPQFVVPDLVKTAEYYRDVLGFTIRGYWMDPPVYSIIERDGVEIHLGKGDRPVAEGNVDRRKGGLDAYISVQGVDALYEEFRSRNADIVEGPSNARYGQREMMVRDCNGFVVGFGEPIENDPS